MPRYDIAEVHRKRVAACAGGGAGAATGAPAVTQPWQADVVFRALPPETFATFDSAGYVRIVVSIAADSVGPTESIVRTETRALATDATSRAKFRRYWSEFSPGILLIRFGALSLARREAQERPRSSGN